MILLDTYALLWWINDPKKLSKKALSLIEKEKKNGKILISSISAWEIYMLIKQNKLKLDEDTSSWIDKVSSLPFIEFIPIDNQIAEQSVNLPGNFHKDPADRMIIATARENGAVVISKDEKIQKYSFVKAIW
jgi:PIN domain nuclease of toxin-antitoxin system